MILPKSPEERTLSREARKQIPLFFSSKNWEHREQTGDDFGLDMIFEYFKSGEPTGKKIEVQIKGRTTVPILKNGDISFPFETKTINYALNSNNPFILMLFVDTSREVYFLNIKEYFLNYKEEERNSQITINVHIPKKNICSMNDDQRFIDIVEKTR